MRPVRARLPTKTRFRNRALTARIRFLSVYVGLKPYAGQSSPRRGLVFPSIWGRRHSCLRSRDARFPARELPPRGVRTFPRRRRGRLRSHARSRNRALTARMCFLSVYVGLKPYAGQSSPPSGLSVSEHLGAKAFLPSFSRRTISRARTSAARRPQNPVGASLRREHSSAAGTGSPLQGFSVLRVFPGLPPGVSFGVAPTGLSSEPIREICGKKLFVPRPRAFPQSRTYSAHGVFCPFT